MTDPFTHQVRTKALESAIKETTEAAAAFDTVQRRVIDQAIGFFDKVALFDTGTIAASVTLASTLRQHRCLVWEDCLFSGWIILIIAMSLCFLRNWKAQHYIYYDAAARYQEKRALRLAAEIQLFSLDSAPHLVDEFGNQENRESYIAEADSKTETFQKNSAELLTFKDNVYKLLTLCERCALVFTTVGVFCVVVFAIKNLA